MTPNIPLTAWTPDGDLTQPGTMADVTQFLPTKRGYAPDYSPADTGVTYTLPSRVYGAKLLKFATNTPTLVVGTGTGLYACFGSVQDISRGTAYTAVTSALEGWWFDAFGDVALAISKDNPLQASSGPAGGVDFADVSGGPAGARSMCVASNFVMIASASTYDEVRWSALEDYTDWTADLATQAGSKRLLETPGPVTRLIAYRNNVIVFKPGSVLRGVWVNAPAQGRIWDFKPISTSVGIVGPHAVCEAEGVLYWIAQDGFYRYDGQTVQRIRSAPWDWFGASCAEAYIGYTQAQWDAGRRVVRFYYIPRVAGVFPDLTAGIAYHPDTDRWGRFACEAEWVAHANAESYPLIEDYTKYRTIAECPVIFDRTSRKVQRFFGAPLAATFTTGDFGNGDEHFVLTDSRFQWWDNPSSSTGTHYYRNTLGETLEEGVSTPATSDQRYEFGQSARWHRIKVATTGQCELHGFRVETPKAGKR